MKIENSNFIRLVGMWKTTGTIKSETGDLMLIGTDSYELILDGNCILHKADVKIGTERSATLEIIKLNKVTDKATMQYFNAHGEDGKMVSTLVYNAYKIEGDGLKFNGTIDEENTRITGKWYRKAGHGEWVEFMNINLEK